MQKFYHVTPKENVPSIMRRGLIAPAHMLTSVETAHKWRVEVEEYEPAVVLEVALPDEWVVSEDQLHPKGMAVMSEEDIPASYIKLIAGGEEPTGTCYPDAWRFLMKQGEGFLIHGSAQLSPEGARVNHAWVETTYGWVWEPQTGQYFTVEDFNRMFAPIEDARYNAEEAAIMLARVGKHGPWSAEERQEYLSRWLK